MRRHSGILSAVAVCCALFAAAPVRGFIITPSDPDPWLSTASGSRPGNGAPATLTWSIVPDGSSVSRGSGGGTTTSNLISFMNTNFSGNPGQTNLALQPWFHIFTDSFGRWSQLGGVNFVYDSHDDGVFHPGLNGVLGVRGDIRLAGFNIDGTSGTLAFTYLPPSGSDMAIDTAEASFFSNSTNNFINFRDTLMHEIGHSFGLEHVISTSNLLMAPAINTSFDGPRLDEVRGVQFFFGDVNDKSNGGAGNSTAANATSLGTIAAGGTKTVGAAANVPGQAIGASATDFVSISNLDDKDFYSFTVSQQSRLGATLTPRGGVFEQAGFTQAGEPLPPTTFDANSRSNLALTIFSTNGSTILTTADSSPAGGIESLANLLLPAAGTYFARVTGADDTIQMYDLSLSVASVLLGDYNNNGKVDGADYVVWRNTQGQSVVAGTGADGNFDGQITPADYGVWRTHFGQVAGSGSAGDSLSSMAVPEPASLMLAGIAFANFISSAARRRRSPAREVDRAGQLGRS